MRFLALVVILTMGPATSLGIGEFEKKIESATSISEKVALAEQAFESIMGFVPRELFMSYWSIEALEGIADSYKAVKEVEGIFGLIPEYSNIARICTMEMGDFRYYFEPLKTELDTLISSPHIGIGSAKDTLSESTSPTGPLPRIWSSESINSLIEYWVISGAIEQSLDTENLRKVIWSRSDMEYWDILYAEFGLQPAQLVVAMEARLQFGYWEPRANALHLVNLITYGIALSGYPSIELHQSQVSVGGPRLY